MARTGTQLELHFCSQVTLDTGINITIPNDKHRMYTDETTNCVTVNGINKIEDIPKVKPMEIIQTDEHVQDSSTDAQKQEKLNTPTTANNNNNNNNNKQHNHTKKKKKSKKNSRSFHNF